VIFKLFFKDQKLTLKVNKRGVCLNKNKKRDTKNFSWLIFKKLTFFSYYSPKAERDLSKLKRELKRVIEAIFGGKGVGYFD